MAAPQFLYFGAAAEKIPGSLLNQSSFCWQWGQQKYLIWFMFLIFHGENCPGFCLKAFITGSSQLLNKCNRCPAIVRQHTTCWQDSFPHLSCRIMQLSVWCWQIILWIHIAVTLLAVWSCLQDHHILWGMDATCVYMYPFYLCTMSR